MGLAISVNKHQTIFDYCGFGSRVEDFGFQAWGFVSRISDFRLSVSRGRFRVSGLGHRVHDEELGLAVRVSSFAVRDSGLGFRVEYFGFRAWGPQAKRFRISGLGAKLGLRAYDEELGLAVGVGRRRLALLRQRDLTPAHEDSVMEVTV